MRVRSRLTFLLTAILATSSLAANAAQITYKGGDADHMAAVFINGFIAQGDAARFAALVDAIPEKTAVVFLTGPGGVLIDGPIIGENIRIRGFLTAVIDECASVCSLIWLAGKTRFVDASSGGGFHAAYAGRAPALMKAAVATPWSPT